MKLNLVTVTGHNTVMLPHMLSHYKEIVDNIYVVVYLQTEDDPVLQQVEDLGITPHKVVIEEKFNWNKVTDLYNEVKSEKPEEWWIVADDDELQVYPSPPKELIKECEENGWEFITGGFLDRIGIDGTLPKINKDSNVWEEFPLAGFFRYPISKACPNKVCLMKGNIKVTPGQHYVQLEKGRNTWGYEGLQHPKRYPVDKGFIQVHHFKWDNTVIERLKEVSNIETTYSYWEEYELMYEYFLNNNFRVDIHEKSFYISKGSSIYNDFKNWEHLTQQIVLI